MRVAVVSDRIVDLDSGTAGTALARGFAPLAQVAVVPVAASGVELARAFAALHHVEPSLQGDRWLVRTSDKLLVGLTQPGPGWQPGRSSAPLGQWLMTQLGDEPEVILDLTEMTAHDGGAGMLEVAAPALTGRRLRAVVGPEDCELPATGIGGGLAARAFAAGVEVADLVAADAALGEWAQTLGEGLAQRPGSGAAGTLGLAILALGGEVASGTQFCYREAGLDATLAAADLVVTGCTELSTLDHGGPVIMAVLGWAATAQKPCVLFTTGEVLSRRELRRYGVEASHRIPADAPSPQQVTAAVARMATSWVTADSSPHLD